MARCSRRGVDDVGATVFPVERQSPPRGELQSNAIGRLGDDGERRPVAFFRDRRVHELPSGEEPQQRIGHPDRVHVAAAYDENFAAVLRLAHLGAHTERAHREVADDRKMLLRELHELWSDGLELVAHDERIVVDLLKMERRDAVLFQPLDRRVVDRRPFGQQRLPKLYHPGLRLQREQHRYRLHPQWF